MMIFVNVALEERGMGAEYLITSGNEAGLGIADYIAFFADEPELKVIIVYVEAIADLEKFKAACRLARAAGKAHRRDQARPVRERPLRRDGAYRVARGLGRGFRRGGRRNRRRPRRHARRCGRDHRTARPYRRAERPAARRDDAVRRVSRPAARCRGAQRAAVSGARRRDLGEAQGARRRLAGPQSDRRRLRRAAAAPTITWPRSRRCRTIRTSTWCCCRSRCRARRAPTAPSNTFAMVEAMRGRRRAEADRLHHAELARPDRLQPRAARARRRMSRSCRKPTRRCAPSKRGAARRARARWRRAARTARVDARRSQPPSARVRALAQRPAPRRSTRSQSKDLLRAYGIADAGGDRGALAGRGRRSGAADRLSGRAEGGVGKAAAQVGRRRGGACILPTTTAVRAAYARIDANVRRAGVE